MKISGIYQILNLISNKRYIGSAKYLSQRFNTHKYALRHNKWENPLLKNAWNKYGEENFKFEVLEEVTNPTREKLLEREQYYLDLYKSYERNNGYNILRIAGSPIGFKLTEEQKLKIGLASKGRNIGKIRTQETRDKISESKKGFKHSDESKQKMSVSRTGKPNGTLGYKRSDATKLKISLAGKGLKRSAETKQRLSIAKFKMWQDRKLKGL